MSHQVAGIVAAAKGEPVKPVDILVPDPGPGEALDTGQGVRRLPHRPALP